MKEHEQKLSRIDRKKIETRKKIINTTISLIQSKGFEATTMEQIAKKTDIAKGTLYNYYSVKEAIISDYIKQTFQTKNINRLSQLKTLTNTRSRMVYIINNLMDGVKLHKEMFEKYLVYQMKQMVSFEKSDDEGSGIVIPIVTIIELGQKEGEIRDDFSLIMLTEFFQFIFIEVVKQYYMNPEGFNQNKVIERSIDLFINGVKPVTNGGRK